MFKKLQLQMTLLGVGATGFLLVVFSVLCLRLTLDNLASTSYQSFLSEVNTDILHLQEQEDISLRWLGQIQESSSLLLFLYDNQNPLYTQQYINRALEAGDPEVSAEALADEVIRWVAERYSLDIRVSSVSRLTEHTEFTFRPENGGRYYASVGRVPRESGQLGFVILCPLAAQQKTGLTLILTVCALDVVSLALLLLFFRKFTANMIRPLKEAQEKQALFIASASHELRAPLAVWLSGLEVLSKTEDPGERGHFTRLLQEEGVRMKRLVEELLLLARSDSREMALRRERCQPDSLLLDVYEKSEPVAAKKKLRLSVELPEELLEEADLDGQRITQALEILISNAISYTPEGGRVTLSLRREKQKLCFLVSDTGCGIPDQEKTRIFERFYRCDQSRTDREHFGLGLCIAKEIVDAHGGELWVEDVPGGGSRFCIRIPVNGAGRSRN